MNVTARAVIDVASTWVGYNGGPNYSTPFGSWYGLPNELWCAMFVSYCEAKAANATGAANPIAGIESAKGFAWTPAGVAWFKGRGRWRAAHGSYKPQPGDLVFWSYGANGPGLASHVGIVTAAGTSSGFWTIQGDTTDTESGDGNCCRRKWVANNNPYLLGFGLPDYGTAPASTPARIYTVEPGDTLSGIAAANHTTWPALAKLNNLANPNRIDVGQVLKLPAAASSPASTGPTTAKYTPPPNGGTWPLAAHNYFGLRSGGNASHGGALASDRVYVGWIQTRINELGFGELRVDEDFGPATQRGVTAWQKHMHAATTTRYGEVWSDDWANLTHDR